MGMSKTRGMMLETTFARSTIPGGITLTQHVLITRQTNGALPTVNLEKDGCTIGEKSKIKRLMELTPLRHAAHAELDPNGPIIRTERFRKKTLEKMTTMSKTRGMMLGTTFARSTIPGGITLTQHVLITRQT